MSFMSFMELLDRVTEVVVHEVQGDGAAIAAAEGRGAGGAAAAGRGRGRGGRRAAHGGAAGHGAGHHRGGEGRESERRGGHGLRRRGAAARRGAGHLCGGNLGESCHKTHLRERCTSVTSSFTRHPGAADQWTAGTRNSLEVHDLPSKLAVWEGPHINLLLYS